MKSNGLTSIIIPVYNESAYIQATLQRCLALSIPKEIIVVDNNSTDNSYDLVSELITYRGLAGQVKLLRARQQGKANAVKVGLLHAKGDFIVLHDADFEYDAAFIPSMVEGLETHDAVHGCRVCNPYSIGVFPFLANKLLLHMMSRRYNRKLNDIFTGQRAYTRAAILDMALESAGFELETELTIRALNEGLKIKEIDVTYKPRNRQEGKKIGIADFIDIVIAYEMISQRVKKQSKRKCIAHTA